MLVVKQQHPPLRHQGAFKSRAEKGLQYRQGSKGHPGRLGTVPDPAPLSRICRYRASDYFTLYSGLSPPQHPSTLSLHTVRFTPICHGLPRLSPPAIGFPAPLRSRSPSRLLSKQIFFSHCGLGMGYLFPYHHSHRRSCFSHPTGVPHFPLIVWISLQATLVPLPPKCEDPFHRFLDRTDTNNDRSLHMNSGFPLFVCRCLECGDEETACQSQAMMRSRFACLDTTSCSWPEQPSVQVSMLSERRKVPIDGRGRFRELECLLIRQGSGREDSVITTPRAPLGSYRDPPTFQERIQLPRTDKGLAGSDSLPRP